MKMSNLEHYFENILYDNGLYDDDPNMEFLTKEEIEAVRTCASYILYSIFCNRERFLKFVKEFETDPIDCIEAIKKIDDIINISNIAIQEDVIKYKMICDVIKKLKKGEL